MASKAIGKQSGSSSSRSGAAKSRSTSRNDPTPMPSASDQPSTPMPWPALIPLGHHQGKPPIPIMRPVLLIGSRHNAHLHLLSRQISKAHALLISSDGKVYVRDLASRTHVYVNGQEVREADLVDGDLLKLGSFTFKFQAAAGAKQRPAVDTTAAGQLDVDGGEFPIQIDQRVMLIGRRPSSDISLVEESCSTAHAVIFSMGGKRFVRDLGSRTGTHVNGKAVRQQEINFGDVVRIGDTDIHYNAVAEAAAHSPSGIDELEDLVGTAPLVNEDLRGHEEMQPDSVVSTEAPLDLDFASNAPESPAEEIFPPSVPATAQTEEAASGSDEAPLPMLIGDNLISEKLSSSATGAGMQAAAREALEMARKHESEAVGHEAPIPSEMDHAIPLAPEPPAGETKAGVAEAQSETAIPLVGEAPSDSGVDAEEIPVAGDDTIEAGESEAIAAPVAPEASNSELLPPIEEISETSGTFDAAAAAASEDVTSHVSQPSEPADLDILEPEPAVDEATGEFASVAAEQAESQVDPQDEASAEIEPVAEGPEVETSETSELEPPAEVRTAKSLFEKPLAWREQQEVAEEPAAAEPQVEEPVDVEAHEEVSAGGFDVAAEPVEELSQQAEESATFDAAAMHVESESTVTQPPAETSAVEPHEPAVQDEVTPQAAVSAAPVIEDKPAEERASDEAAVDELFFGDETLDEITHDEVTAADDLELGTSGQGNEKPAPANAVASAAPVEQVMEPTEPSIDSALALDITEAAAAPAESAATTIVEPSLSDTSFGRQVQEFAAQSPDPIIEATTHSEELPPEELEELPESITSEAAECQPPIESAAEAVEPVSEPVAEPLELDADSITPPMAVDSLEITEPAESDLPQGALDIAPQDDAANSEAAEDADGTADAFELEPIETSTSDWQPAESVEEDTIPAAPEPTASVDATTAPEAIAEPQHESTVTPPPLLVPGMPLNLSAPMMPDFVSGLPLALDELPGPPASFGRVQVGFGDKQMPRARVDTLRDKTEEVGPFDNLQIDIDNPVASPAPVTEPPLDELDEFFEPELPEQAAEPVGRAEDVTPSEDSAADEPVLSDELPADLDFASEPQGTADGETHPEPELAAEAEPHVDPLQDLPLSEETPGTEPVVQASAEAIADAQVETPVEPRIEMEQQAEAAPHADVAAESEPAIDEKPKGRGLFQSKLRIPPPPRRMRIEPQEEPAHDAPPPGFESTTVGPGFGRGGFGQATGPFSGLVGGAGGSADVFSSGFSADLSNDPVFGSAVKPLEEPIAQPANRRKAATPARPGKRVTEVTPADEAMAKKLADELGAPPIASESKLEIEPAPSAEVSYDQPLELVDDAGTSPAVEEAEIVEKPTVAPRAQTLPVPTPMEMKPQVHRRGGKRVAVLLAVMVLVMAAAAFVIYHFCQERIAYTGSISYQNFGNLQQGDQRRLQESQKSLLVSERARDVAVNDFRSHHLELPLGFLGSAEDFAHNETRVSWTESHPGGGNDTLVYRYEGSDKADKDRVFAVLNAIYQLDQEMISDADKAKATLKQNQETLQEKQSELGALEARRKDINEKMAHLPDDEQLRALKADNDAAQNNFRTAFDAARAAEAALKSLEQVPGQASTSASAPVPADPQLQELQKALDEMKNKLMSAKNTVEERADLARKGLDSAIEEFQKSTTIAEGLMKDNPELSAFVAQAQKLQDTVQKLTGDLLDRQQKSYEKQLDEKRFIEDRLAQRRKELWDSDKEMKRIKDDLAMRERGYNAAVGQGYDKEAGEIKKDLDDGLAQVEKRKMELESDPMLVTLTDLLARSQEQIAAAQKQLEQDRKQADAVTEELQKNFARLEPDVQKLPQSQRNLAQQMTSRMDAVNNARRSLADAVEAKNADVNPGLKLLEEQVQSLSAKVEDRRKVVAMVNSQKLPADEQQKQKVDVEQKRAAYATAVKAEADAENALLKKRQALLDAQANAADGTRARNEYEKVTRQYFDLRDKELPQLKASCDQAEQLAQVAAFPSRPSSISNNELADPRLTYTALAIAAIAIAFSLLIIFTGSGTHHTPVMYSTVPATAMVQETPLVESVEETGANGVNEQVLPPPAPAVEATAA